jgi:hypothetical protein
MIEILIILFCFISGLLNSTEDLFKDKYYQSIFRDSNHVWFSYDSWKNKYVNRDSKQGRVKIKLFGYEFIKPVQFTDWWHFSKMLNLTLLFVSMLLSISLEMNFLSVIVIVAAGCLRNVGFTLGYTKLFYKP